MKNFVFLLFLIILQFNSYSLISQTTIPGGEISGIWYAENSPFIVDGTITVTQDSCLIIKPGVTVKFNPGSSLRVLRGEKLIAVGTPDSTIVFTSNDPNPSPGDWSKIYLSGTEDDCLIKYAIIEYAVYGIHCRAYAYGCDDYDNFTPIEHCEIRYTSQRGIFCEGEGSSTGCTFPYTGNSNPTIRNNKIYSNNGYGLYLAAYDGYFSNGHVGALVQNNLIYNNESDGIRSFWGDPVIPKLINNTIHNNGGSGVHLINSMDSLNYLIENNNISSNNRGIWLENSLLPIINFNNLWQNIKGNYISFNSPINDISVEPNYYNPNIGDFNLQCTSQCINAGNPSSPNDPDGSIADIGALWFNPNEDGFSISNNSPICEEQELYLYATGGDSYEWNGVNDFYSSEQNPEISLVNPGLSGLYSVTISTNTGCIIELSTEVLINPVPNTEITGDFIICEGESTVLTANGGSSYEWNTGSEENSIEISDPGEYSVTATDENGCIDKSSVSIEVNPNPIAEINGEFTICRGESAELMASGGAQYMWNTGEDDSSIEVDTEGIYTVTVTSNEGCVADTSVELLVHELPEVMLTGDLEICEGESTELMASGGAQYMWNTGEDNSSIEVDTEGIYTVIVTSNEGCVADTSVELLVHELPEVMLTGDLEICKGESTEITASGGAEYIWSTGEDDSSIEVDTEGIYTVIVTSNEGCVADTSVELLVHELPEVMLTGDLEICKGESTEITASGGAEYIWSTGEDDSSIEVDTEGIYTVTVTSNEGCVADTSVELLVHELPEVMLTGDVEICKGESTEITASGGAQYMWNTGEDNSSIEVDTEGIYTVIVTSNEGCAADTSVELLVHELPEVMLTGDVEICKGESTEITASGGAQYMWNTGEDNSSIEVDTEGIYTVTVTSNEGCVADTSVELLVHELPEVMLTGDLEICEGESTELMASGGAQYMWNTGEDNSSIEVDTEGIYTVTVTSNEGCAADTSVELLVHELPEVMLTGDLEICKGESTEITASGGAEYIWNTGEDNSSIEVDTEGIYTVTVTSNEGCVADTSVELLVHELPEVMLTGDLEICKGESTEITASGGAEYIWNTGEDNSSIEVDTEGIYTVIVTSNEGCVADTSVELLVHELPEVMLTGDVEICKGESTEITASGGAEYIWNTGEDNSSIEVDTEGIYTVIVTSNEGCVADTSVELLVHELPEVMLTGDLEICKGESTEITASGGAQYMWNTGHNTSSIVTSQAGQYTVTVTSDQGCSSNNTVELIVNELPIVILELPQDTFCTSNEEIILKGGSPEGGDYYGQGITGGVLNPSDIGEGIYTIEYKYVDENACQNSAFQDIEISEDYCTTPVVETESTQFLKVYPNPSFGNILIELQNWHGLKELRVFDLSGRLVLLQKTANRIFEIENLPRGVFIAKISDQRSTLSKKIIVID